MIGTQAAFLTSGLVYESFLWYALVSRQDECTEWASCIPSEVSFACSSGRQEGDVAASASTEHMLGWASCSVHACLPKHNRVAALAARGPSLGHMMV